MKLKRANIFYLDKNPKICASYHVDKHCVKMILEYAQLLSTAHRIIDGMEVIIAKKKYWQLPDNRNEILYSATHLNHPSAIWARANNENYMWLVKLLQELSCEYTYRYGKIHKVEKSGLLKELFCLPNNIYQDKFFTPPSVMPDELIIEGNSVESYRNYYNASKQQLFSWKKRDVPFWVKK